MTLTPLRERPPDSVMQRGDPDEIEVWKSLIRRINALSQNLQLGDYLAAVNLLTAAANKLAYATGADSAAFTDFTALAQTLLADATAAAMRSTLGLVIGTDVQADLDVVPQAEAEAGSATTERVWTALRVKQAIAALGDGGLWVELDRLSISGSPSTASVTKPSANDATLYDYYRLTLIDVYPNTSAANLLLQMTEDDGSTVIAGTGYGSGFQTVDQSGTTGTISDAGTSGSKIATSVTNSNGSGVSGVFEFYNITTQLSFFTGHTAWRNTTGPIPIAAHGGGRCVGNSGKQKDGVRLTLSSGTFGGGDVVLEGRLI